MALMNARLSVFQCVHRAQCEYIPFSVTKCALSILFHGWIKAILAECIQLTMCGTY